MTQRRRAARRIRAWTRLRSRAGSLRRGALAALCGLGLAGGGWYVVPSGVHQVKSHPYFALGELEVEGNRRLSRQEVLQWAGVAAGTSIWDAAPDVVRLRLQSHPWVRRASVQRAFPNRMTISVRERRPVAIARLEELSYIDRGGNVLGPLRADDSRDFPLITGLGDAEDQAFATIGLHRALQLLRLCERLSCFDAVSEVSVDRYRGVTVFPLRTAVAVVLGWGSWREKLARSARVFAAWEGQVGRLAAVDVSFRDQVVVKLREERPVSAVRASKRGMRV